MTVNDGSSQLDPWGAVAVKILCEEGLTSTSLETFMNLPLGPLHCSSQGVCHLKTFQLQSLNTAMLENRGRQRGHFGQGKGKNSGVEASD